MKNLTTRKIVLGLLMTCVLAFGVQGVVDAVQYSEVAETTLISDSLYAISDTLTGPNLTFTPDDNDRTEVVTITISSGILLTTDGHHGKNKVTLTETGDSGTIGGLNVTGRFLDDGKQTITVKGKDYDDSDDPDGFSGGNWTQTYVYYVTQPAPNASTATINLVSIRNGYKAEVYRDISVYGGDNNNYAVTYSPNTGLTYKIPERTADIEVPTTAISSKFKVTLTGDTESDVITARVTGSELSTTGAYFYGQPVLAAAGPTGTTVGSGTESNPGTANALLTDAFRATVAGGESGATNSAGILVKFEVKDKTSAGGNLVFTEASDETNGTLVDSSNKQIWDANRGERVKTGSGKILYVRTGATNAQVDFRLGTAAEQKVTISAVGQSKEVSAFTDVPDTYELSVDEIQDISGKYGLYVLAENAGEPLAQGWDVVFTTARGAFEGTGTEDTGTGGDYTPPTDGGRRIVQHTDERGIAYVIFDPKDNSGTLEVTASIKNNLDFAAATARTTARLTFDVLRGAPTTRPRDDQQVTNTITVSPSVLTGEPSTTHSLTVSAGTATVRVQDASAFTTAGGTISGSGATRSVTLPDTPGSDYTITFSASGYADVTVPVVVTAASTPGTLSITAGGARVGTQQSITVTASGRTIPSEGLVVRLHGVTNPLTVTIPSNSTSASRIVTLPSASSAHSVYASAPGYTNAPSITILSPGQQPGDTPQQTQQGTSDVASSLQAGSSVFANGTVDTQLTSPLRVRVLDANENGVSNVRVTFRVTSGRGRLSQRGNGRATQTTTDSQGYATANYTPLNEGTSTVRVNATGITQTVTFTITTGEAPDDTDDTPTTTPGTDVATSREVNPVVQVGAAHRPPMLWVDGGKIYALVGADVQEFGSGVAGAMNIAVGGGKVYWTEQTGESAGTINSANLDGSDAKELKSLRAVPMGIAIDVANSKLYWTNARGRIQSLNADGSDKIENVMQNLPGPRDIAVARGNLYWTQYDATANAGNVGILNPTSQQKAARYISTGSDMPGSLTISGKLYWTEMTGTSAGTINSASLSGTAVMELASIRAVPMGIAVDGSRSKLYWGNSRGRIQSANLDGSKISNVVDGLGSPGDMVLSNSITAPTAMPSPTETAAKKYDVNGDGTVDGKDKVLVLEAVMADTYVAKYDVNNDKKLDILDYVLVDVEADAGAAGAPALLGMKMTALEVDRLQEQIDLLIATNDRSPAAMRTLIYLQQLIVMARPEKTQLLANYPNPFNPETWIPYELATDTNVRITIYNAQGVVIRTLQLGQQSAGYYTDRERAAYWDGRNALGEQVASGVYFYQFETDEMSSMRKMVILK